MAEEVNIRLNHRRTPSGQFTATTYPGGLPDEISQRDSISRLFSLTQRRRSCLAISTFSLLVVFLFKSSTDTSIQGFRVMSLYPRPGEESDTSRKGLLEHYRRA
jgi:hypothetical protein